MYKIILFLFLIGGFTGCATTAIGDSPSLKNAGTTSVEVEPVFAKPDEVLIGTKYKAVFAKEYDDFNASLNFDKEGNVVGLTISAGEVRAFKGQEAAAMAYTDIQKALSDMGVELSKEAASAVKSVLLKALVPVP